MDLSPSAQELRNLANKLQQISEYDTHSDTGEPDHVINTNELLRLKVALRPLVDGPMQSSFMQILNKINDGQPVTTGEAKVITAAFISMADIIASDNGLLARLRKDINDFNTSHQPELETETEQEEPDNLDLNLDEPEEAPAEDEYKLK
jgi:hypothetical protein